MKTIEIEDDLYKYILANIEAFGETPSQILRRLLSIQTPSNDEEKVESASKQVDPIKTSKEEINNNIEQPTYSAENVLLPDEFSHGVEVLLSKMIFQSETIVTNKFKMILTTMYYENKDAFGEAAKVAKGRSRDYLGQNLQLLLASENEEELALFIASKPREIPFTPFWVVTNANSGRKRIILTQVMASMGYPHYLIERVQHEI